jgi:DNA-binding FadR family transcriptional regulator
MNRSTLRQALTTLVDDGHLVAVRGRGGGTFVAEAPPLWADDGAERLGRDARGLLDHRVAIETGATALAAERAEAGDLDRLDQLVDRVAVTNSFGDYRRADVRFHIGVAEAAHSPRLVTAMTEAHGHLSDLIARVEHPPDRLTRSNDQHRRLVTVLRRGDSSLAVLLMRAHIERTEHVLDARRGKGPDRFESAATSSDVDSLGFGKL